MSTARSWNWQPTHCWSRSRGSKLQTVDHERTLAEAARLLTSGHLDSARALYQQVLSVQSASVVALRSLAYIARQRGQAGQAAGYIARAIAAQPADPKLRVAHAQLLKAGGDMAGARAAFQAAIDLDPCCVDAWLGLGVLLRAQGELNGALECCERVRELAPEDAGALVNLGNVLAEMQRIDDAEAAYRHAIRIAPQMSDAFSNLGKLVATHGRPEEGKECLRQALALNSSDVDAALHLGQLERATGRLEAAHAIVAAAVAAAPQNALGRFLLAETLKELNQYEESIAHYRECVRLDPQWVEPLVSLSLVLRSVGRVSESELLTQRALALAPNDAEARFGVADALFHCGDAEAAFQVQQELVQRDDCPDYVFQTFLAMSNYVPGMAPATLARSYAKFEERFVGRIVHFTHRQKRDAQRRLRIGYLSADFRDHSVAYFVEPVWVRHDRAQVEAFAYFNNVNGDAVTQRLRGCTDGWMECGEANDDVLGQRIHDDRIDILVDLSGHTGGNRLHMLARKPAPVQVTWLGYPTTTGMSAIDYRISDWEVDPAGYEDYSTERLVRMSSSYYCYRPPVDAPPVGPLPARGAGRVTFASFNNLGKVSAEALALWGRILEAVPGSQLLLKSKALLDEGVRRRVLDRVSAAGMDVHRVRLHGWSRQTDEHLGLYHEVDIGLDTYPYNGATTTCEALWMGVPVVTLKGNTHASRMGASVLKAAGFGHWVAESAEEYVHLAVQLAGQQEQLEQLRGSLRERLRGSRLLDETGFTRELEAAYRQMWLSWCESGERAG